jgi:hypothetical protein
MHNGRLGRPFFLLALARTTPLFRAEIESPGPGALHPHARMHHQFE